MKPHSRSPRGFTMVEVMIASVIFAIICVAVMMFANRQTDFWEMSTTQADLRVEAEQAVNRMGQELHMASTTAAGASIAIPTPAPNNISITFYLPNDNDNNGTILDNIGSVEWSNAPVQFQYNAGARELRRVVGVNQQTLAHDVQVLTFENRALNAALQNNEVRINLTLQRTTPHQRVVAATATAIVVLRN